MIHRLVHRVDIHPAQPLVPLEENVAKKLQEKRMPTGPVVQALDGIIVIDQPPLRRLHQELFALGLVQKAHGHGGYGS